MIWIWVLMLGPVVGPIAYVAVEMLPWTLLRTAAAPGAAGCADVKKVLNPAATCASSGCAAR